MEVLPFCETALHRAIKETEFSPLFFVRAPLDTILGQLKPVGQVGHTPVIWFAKHRRNPTVIFTSECLTVFITANPTGTPLILYT